jgi:serine/threonine protein kinase
MTCPKCNAPTLTGAKFCIRCGHRLAASAAPTELESSTWQPGQVLVDDFVVARELGAGGMGTVYLVRGRSSGDEHAVKISQIQDPAGRRRFLSEVQTWIDLPAHPHLASCRFVRTIGDRVAVFAEYLEGGSLAQWIAAGKVSRLAEILDVAIQVAWGLHAAHEQGLVHQDVKPGNVLLTAAGVAKVGDFGLARARKQVGASSTFSSTATGVSMAGMTLAYCSPEQAAGQMLTRATDVWSWGLTVLEMLLGEVTWANGAAAAEIFEDFLVNPPTDTGRPPMSPVLTEILHKCFRARPSDRWTTLAEPADQLVSLFEKATRGAYPRPRPAFPRTQDRPAFAPPRQQPKSGPWDDPRQWLRLALEHAGRDPAEVEALVAPGAASRSGQTVADLAVFEEARRILEDLVNNGRQDLEMWLAGLYEHMANVHGDLGNLDGMEALADRAIVLAEQVLAREGEGRMAEKLASAYFRKANALLARDPAGARHVMARAVALLERVVRHERPDLRNYLASAYNSQGRFCRSQGDPRGALDFYNRAIQIREGLLRDDPKWEHARDLAVCYMNKANLLYSEDDTPGALGYFDKCIQIRERLVHEEGRSELASSLALAYSNRAGVAVASGMPAEGHRLCDQALTIYRELLDAGRADVVFDLGRVLYNLATCHTQESNLPAALAALEEAFVLWNRLVHQEGRRELLGEYAMAQARRGELLCQLGDRGRGCQEVRQAVALLEAEAARTHRPEVREKLTTARAILSRTVD